MSALSFQYEFRKAAAAEVHFYFSIFCLPVQVRFTEFSVYWVAGAEMEVTGLAAGEWRPVMRSLLERQAAGLGNHHLLLPLSGRMKIMMNRCIRDGAPRLLFDYVLKVAIPPIEQSY